MMSAPMMRTAPPRLPYLARFAARDLFEVTSLRTTLAAVLTIAAAVGFAVLSRGLALGAYDVQVRRLRDDPVNRSLWYGNPSTRMMTPDRVATIAAAVGRDLPSGGIEGVYPFSQTPDDWEWLRADGQHVGFPVGRTIRPDDRLLESYREGSPPPPARLGPADQGIVASPRMLMMLGYPDPRKAPPPPSLRLRLPDRREPLPVTLLGVTRTELPLFTDFLISEGYEAQLRQANPNPPLDHISTGPVPAAWADAARTGNLPAEVSELITGPPYNLLPPEAVPDGQGFAWVLTHPGDVNHPALETWRRMLRQIAGAMTRNRFPDAPRFTELPPGQFTTASPEPIKDHQFVAVVVAEAEIVRIPQAERAANAVLAGAVRPEYAVPLNQGTADEIVKLIGQTEQALLILTILSLGVASVASLNLLVVEWLRAERKLPEWGMLKAVGMTGPQLEGLAILEGTILGGLGAVLGMAVAFALGRFISARFYRERPIDAELGFAWTPLHLALILALAVCLCAFGTWLANRKARVDPPCESLRMR
jgi:hypothetical protein